MKKILIILFAVGLAYGASAQKYRGGYYHSRPRVTVGIVSGYSPFYSPYYSPYGYNNFGYGSGVRPSRLDLEIQDIRLDYADRIKSVKMDLKGKEKRQRVRELKNERDRAIVAAQRNYYYKRSGH